MIKIRVSEEFAKYLNKVFKERGIEAYAEMKVCNERHYRFFVSCDVFAAEDYGDCDEFCEEFRYIQVSYPESYYAVPHNTTTQELKQCLRSYIPNVGCVPCRTEEELKDSIVDLFEA